VLACRGRFKLSLLVLPLPFAVGFVHQRNQRGSAVKRCGCVVAFGFDFAKELAAGSFCHSVSAAADEESAFFPVPYSLPKARCGEFPVRFAFVWLSAEC